MATEQRPRVLVVDDMADAANSQAVLLRHWGYDVQVAYQGTDALEIVRAYGPQVVLVDIGMPGMNGFQLIERLRQHSTGANAVVIGITGYSDEIGRARSYQLGFADYLLKPVDPDYLRDLLARLVERKPLPARPTGGQATLDRHGDGPRVSEPSPGGQSGEGRIMRRLGVLVVDDEDSIRRLMDVYLRQEGFAVWLAADGMEATDLYRRHRGEIDVVVLDVCMPGLDGVETLASLRATDPEVRCCFLSADFGIYTERDLCAAGAAALLHKPPRLSEFAQMVRLLARQDVPAGLTMRRTAGPE